MEKTCRNPTLRTGKPQKSPRGQRATSYWPRTSSTSSHCYGPRFSAFGLMRFSQKCVPCDYSYFVANNHLEFWGIITHYPVSTWRLLWLSPRAGKHSHNPLCSERRVSISLYHISLSLTSYFISVFIPSVFWISAVDLSSYYIPISVSRSNEVIKTVLCGTFSDIPRLPSRTHVKLKKFSYYCVYGHEHEFVYLATLSLPFTCMHLLVFVLLLYYNRVIV